ncbi:MAG TPA: OmpA family protein [Blastocatellia bacterium]|nr:OmpA family protein [Blastocatellia bacterium]
MNLPRYIVAVTLVLLMLTGISLAQTVEIRQVSPDSHVLLAKRHTLAVKYKDNDDTSINMIGTSLVPQASGKAHIDRKEGRTRIKLEMQNLGHPQALGPYYTTYILWAIAPEGQADNLAELPVRNEFHVDVTTSFQTFGLIITGEPHSAVKLPSPVIIAENALRKGTEGGIGASRIEYSGDPGDLYVVGTPNAPSLSADYSTPLLILGARRSVEIAKRAGAARYAEPELREAEVKLAALEQTWPRHRRKDLEQVSGLAHDVMRLGERARELTVERIAQARLQDERRAASNAIAQAQTEAERARIDADRARQHAAALQDALSRAEREIAEARLRVQQAQTDADRAKANEELARLEAERARLEAERAKQDMGAMQQRLFESIAAILETRREARGLIVNLSDVLFDFNQASLRPGAREKLSKLAGILLGYPGSFHIEIEGHTDAIGSQDYNQKLSEDRAQSVSSYLLRAGIPSDRIVAVRGFGKLRPVATNDTAEGRQINRRVEIIITDLDTQPVPKR